MNTNNTKMHIKHYGPFLTHLDQIQTALYKQGRSFS